MNFSYNYAGILITIAITVGSMLDYYDVYNVNGQELRVHRDIYSYGTSQPNWIRTDTVPLTQIVVTMQDSVYLDYVFDQAQVDTLGAYYSNQAQLDIDAAPGATALDRLQYVLGVQKARIEALTQVQLARKKG